MEIDGRTRKGKYNDYTAERMTSELTFSMYIQDQQAILQLWSWCPSLLSECEAEVDTLKPPSFSYKCKFCLKKKKTVCIRTT